MERLIIILSFMLIPLGLREVGGFAGMRKALPADFFNLYSSKLVHVPGPGIDDPCRRMFS